VTPAQEAIARLEALDEDQPDEEMAHVEADRILCQFIRAIGHADVTDAFEAARRRVGFWYA
jgi:hypothetical protein